ncbi:MAG: sigma-70 family RNA polymerase sigma factor, partial [Gaiellaceae bacterium]
MEELITPEVYKTIVSWAQGHCVRNGILEYDAQQDILGAAHDAAMKAARTYDPARGWAFTTWLFELLEQEFFVNFSRREDTIIPLPHVKARLWNRILQREASLAQSLGRAPSHAEIAEDASISLEEFHTLRDECSAEFVSMETESEDDEGTLLVWDVLDDNGEALAPDPADILEADEDAEAMWGGVKSLLPQEQAVMELLYGFEGPELTQREAADVLGVDKMEVNRLHSSALAKLQGRSNVIRFNPRPSPGRIKNDRFDALEAGIANGDRRICKELVKAYDGTYDLLVSALGIGADNTQALDML